MTDPSLDDLHAGLPAAILADPWWGDRTLEDPAWQAAFHAVPRHLFAPDTWYEWNGDGIWTTRHRRGDEAAWARAVYAVDQPLITQVDPDTGKPSCSLSAPKLVAAMLGALQLKPGMNVLESGAGCGWTAALMGAFLRSGSIASVEYDEALATRARENINRVASNTFVRPGDGEAGWPLRAPYDVITATHSLWRIPQAWISQTRPGGLVCAPLAVSENGLDVYVRLTVNGDGSASGPVLFPLAFMRSRSEPGPGSAGEWIGDEARSSTTDLDMPAIATGTDLWVLRLAIPGLTVTGPAEEDGDDCVWLSMPDGSWAVGYVPVGKPWGGAVVEQHGPQDVWSLAEAAWASWEVSGRPGLDEYGVSISPGGTHTLWCREPDNVITALCPAPYPASP